jgi:hypothetical protein
MSRRVALVRTAVSEECIAPFITVKIIITEALWFTDPFHPDDGGDMFLRNVYSYKSHTASLPRRPYSS